MKKIVFWGCMFLYFVAIACFVTNRITKYRLDRWYSQHTVYTDRAVIDSFYFNGDCTLWFSEDDRAEITNNWFYKVEGIPCTIQPMPKKIQGTIFRWWLN